MRDEEDLTALGRKLDQHARKLSLTEWLQGFLRFLEPPDWRKPDCPRRPQKDSNENESLNPSALASQRYGNLGDIWDREPESLQQRSPRDRPGLEPSDTTLHQQTKVHEILRERGQYRLHLLFGVDGFGSALERLPQRVDRRIEVGLREEAVEESSLVEGELADGIPGSAVEYPRHLFPKVPAETCPLGLGLRKLMHQIQLGRSPDSHADHRLDAFTIRLGDDLSIDLSPSF